MIANPDRFPLNEKINNGNFGVVYSGTDLLTNK
jgi:hypothetical protein